METEFDIISKMVCSDSSVLEIGCGNGDLLKKMKTIIDAEFLGIDPFALWSENSCEPLRAEEVDKLNKKFDLIYSVHSFHHFKDPYKFFISAKKSLTYGSRVIILDWKHGAKTGVPEYYFRYDELIAMLRDTGYQKVEYWTLDDNQIIIATPVERIRVAVASDGENISSNIFGRTEFFDIYEFRRNRWQFKERIINTIAEQNPTGKTYKILEQLCDCQFLIGAEMGHKGKERTKYSGHRFFKVPAKIKIAESLEKFYDLVV